MEIQQIILASASTHRAKLLHAAAIPFKIQKADIDERYVEQPLIDAGAGPEDIALVLAKTKALSISNEHRNAWVIGCDQTLALDDQLMHKPNTIEQAHQRLLKLSGKTHCLHSAVTLFFDTKPCWEHVETTRITFRDISPEYIGRYTALVGDKILTSVGAYQVEAEGINLIEKIEGDYFSIIGLPILPLLQELRAQKLIDG